MAFFDMTSFDPWAEVIMDYTIFAEALWSIWDANFISRILDGWIFTYFDLETYSDKNFWLILKMLRSLGLITFLVGFLKFLIRMTYVIFSLYFTNFIIHCVLKNIQEEISEKNLKYYKNIQTTSLTIASLYHFIQFLMRDRVMYMYEYNIVRDLIFILKNYPKSHYYLVSFFTIFLFLKNSLKKNNKIKKIESTDNILVEKFTELYFDFLYTYFLLVSLVSVVVIILSRSLNARPMLYSFLTLWFGNKLNNLPALLAI